MDPEEGWIDIGDDEEQVEEQEDDEAMARRLQRIEDDRAVDIRPPQQQPSLVSNFLSVLTNGFGEHMMMHMMGGNGPDGQGRRTGREQKFSKHLQGYSPAMVPRCKASLEHGDKIMLPSSCLYELSERGLLSESLDDSINGGAAPTLFRISSKHADGTLRVVHGGVLEFTAPDSVVVLPVWMMSHLHVDEGAMLRVESCTLARGTKIRLRPVNYAEFKALPNPKALLERALSQNYFTLTKGTTITLGFQSLDYIFEVVSTLPDDAIAILNADVEAEFDLPDDYFDEEEQMMTTTTTTTTPEEQVAVPGRSLANLDEAGAPGNRQCSNCNKWVPEMSYDRHVAFCERNLMRCPDCGDRVPKSEEKAHFERFHVPVSCECGATCPKDMMDTHKQFECDKRMEICQYCELSFSAAELAKHSPVCGSRTQRCSDCRGYVMLSDMHEHKASGCTYKSSNSSRAASVIHSCSECGAPFFSEEEMSTHFMDMHTAEGIQRHVQRQQRETQRLLDELGGRKSSSLFSCDECNISFPSSGGLEAHNTLFHNFGARRGDADDDMMLDDDDDDDNNNVYDNVHQLSLSESE